VRESAKKSFERIELKLNNRKNKDLYLQEKERVSEHGSNFHQIPTGWSLYQVVSLSNSKKVIQEIEQKVKEIMKVISSFDREKNWPSVEEWKNILPNWLTQIFNFMTYDEFVQYIFKGGSVDNIGPNFSVWLNELKDRGWLWWNSELKDNGVFFSLIEDGWPCNKGSFRHILRAAGAKNIQEIDADN